MNKDCSTCICKEGSCYPSVTIFDKDKTCKSYAPDYEGYIAELEQENIELKTKKIPQLERRIASIRGSHRVDVKKLNARIEQVERLKKENAELKEKYVKNITDCDICDTYCNSQLTKAKEIIREFVEWANWQGNSKCPSFKSIQDKAEQFLNSEVEK
jgi:uncharacterized protein (UPF0335 family)